MKPLLIASLVLGLAACSSPRLGANVSVGSGGVSVTPNASARVGPVGVIVTP